jgi:hypothetical protein
MALLHIGLVSVDDADQRWDIIAVNLKGYR